MGRISKMLILISMVKSTKRQNFICYPTRPLSQTFIPDIYFGFNSIWTPTNLTNQFSYSPHFIYPESQLQQSSRNGLDHQTISMPEPYQKFNSEQGSVAPKASRIIRGRGLMIQNRQIEENYELKSNTNNKLEEGLDEQQDFLSSKNSRAHDKTMYSVDCQYPLTSCENYESGQTISETTKEVDSLQYSPHYSKDNHVYTHYRQESQQYNQKDATLPPESLNVRYPEDFDLRSRVYHEKDIFFHKVLNILVKRRSLRALGKKVMTPLVVCNEIFEAFENYQIQISMFFALYCFISRDFITYGNCIWIQHNELVLGKHKEIFFHKTILKRELYKWKELNIQVTSFYQGLMILYSFGKGISESLVDEHKSNYYALFRANVYQVFRELWEK